MINASHHGFSSAAKIGMFDTQTMTKIKDIDVQGRPGRYWCANHLPAKF